MHAARQRHRAAHHPSPVSSGPPCCPLLGDPRSPSGACSYCSPDQSHTQASEFCAGPIEVSNSQHEHYTVVRAGSHSVL